MKNKTDLSRVDVQSQVPTVGSTAKITTGDAPTELADSRPTIEFVTCKRCGCSIEGGLCSFSCEADDTFLDERAPEDVEIRVYTLTATKPYFTSSERTTSADYAVDPADGTQQSTPTRDSHSEAKAEGTK